MVKKYLQIIKPESGISHAVYMLLNIALPLLVLFFVRLDLEGIAAAIVLLAKWRIFAMRPRYWFANIRANLVDIFVGLSIVVFLAGTNTLIIQIIWTALFMVWILWLKPKSNQVPVMSQALIAQVLALVAFYQAFPDHGVTVGVMVAWLVSYVSARHFFGAFEEPHAFQFSQIWAWFSATIAWVLGHWVIVYISIPQVALIITLVGYILALMYYLHANNRLRNSVKHQLIGFITILLLIIIAFSDWQDKTI